MTHESISRVPTRLGVQTDGTGSIREHPHLSDTNVGVHFRCGGTSRIRLELQFLATEPLGGAHPFAYYLAGYAISLAQLKEDLGATEDGRMSRELTLEEERAFREAKLGTLGCSKCGEPLMDARLKPPARGSGRLEDMIHYRVTCKNCGHLHRIG